MADTAEHTTERTLKFEKSGDSVAVYCEGVWPHIRRDRFIIDDDETFQGAVNRWLTENVGP